MMWKQIDEFPRYEVNEVGQVRNTKTGRVLQPFIHSRGYLSFRLSQDGKTYNRFAHRLVAKAFIRNPENKSQVNHKDGDKKNNAVENLEWNTQEENARHAFENGHCSKRFTSRPVVAMKDGEVVGEFDSIKHAQNAFGIDQSNIFKAVTGKRKSAGGFVWTYKEEE